MIKRILMSLVIILATINGGNATSIDYDDLREEYKDFNDQRLNNITEISNYESLKLTADELNALVNSTAFINLKKLDLSGHNELTDDHIIELSNNQQSFKQLLTIDLSNCPKITVKSLEAIRDSHTVGSIRNLPQISARYGLPSSEVKLIIGGKTSIERKEKKEKYSLRPFRIAYQHARGGKSSFNPVNNGIKILNIEY